MLSFSLPSSPSSPPSSPRSPSFPSVQLPSSPRNFRPPSAVSATASPATTAPSSLYEVLEVSIGASNDDIKAAYRRLARSCHPDVTVGNSADVFMRVQAAYSVLSDPDQRADYDRKLCRILRPPQEVFPGLSSSPTSSFCRSPRRNWETDQCW